MTPEDRRAAVLAAATLGAGEGWSVARMLDYADTIGTYIADGTLPETT